MESDQLIESINKLLTDDNFLLLESLQKKSNLFEDLAVSHLELWHSAFVKWLIDPSSGLGLGTFPLKRFLYTVIYKGKINEENRSKLTILEIENKNLDLENKALGLDNMDFKLEKQTSKYGRIDIYAENKPVNEMDKSTLRLIIENKVKAKEGADQTQRYYDYSQVNNDDYQDTLLIFLCPEHDRFQVPKCDKFYRINYQDICDYVIKPCLKHPDLKLENKFLLEQYLYNLKKRVKGIKPMAYPNKDICEKIYEAHKDVLEEIFLSVKGEAPQTKTIREKTYSNDLTLTNLVEKNFLDINDELLGDYKGQRYQAKLEKVNNKVIIKFNDGRIFNSPSSAAKEITNYAMNGWVFWGVDGKGTLEDLRDKLSVNTIESVVAEL